MSDFEILCTTTKQLDTSLISKMNIRSNSIIANQTNNNFYQEFIIENGKKIKFISTDTIGVGINRNLSLAYATAEICLLADDDVVYKDDLENLVCTEFEKHRDADVIIFNLNTASKDRPQKIYHNGHYRKFMERTPWGAPRIAFRLNSIRRKNIWFSTLFGGGSLFPSGEDSIWIKDAIKAGLNIYISDKIIGEVSFSESSWYDGMREKFYYGRGAFYQHSHPKTFFFWTLYFFFRTRKKSSLSSVDIIKWIYNGRKGYKLGLSYSEYLKIL